MENIKINRRLAAVPPMGWMSWNMFGENIHEDLILEIADAIVESGMKDAGYEYVCIDDCWSVKEGRDSYGNLMADTHKFPGGIKKLADYVHGRELKLGIYSDACEHTCAGWPGSYGFEEKDAHLFASWGVDFLKYDYDLTVPANETAVSLYNRMGAAIKKIGSPILYAVCEWGSNTPWLWARSVGGNMWRTAWDIRDHWEFETYDVLHNGIMNALDMQAGLEGYAGPGGWNDPDMLVVGLYNRGDPSSMNGAAGCTDVEYRSQMSLWCLLAAPLIASCDIRNMNDATRLILTNKEVININQDSMGKQGRRLMKQGGSEVWIKPLANGDMALGLLNRGAKSSIIEVHWQELGLSGGHAVRDVWAHEDCGVYKNSFSASVGSHATEVFRLSVVSP